MRLAAAALLLALCAPARAADCEAAYRDYEADWEISRAQWNADCAAGLKPDEILRARQRSFMAACAEHYRPFLAKARLEEWNLQVYCAQGDAGERRLSAMAAAPLRRPPPPPPAAKKAAPDLPLNPARRYYNAVDSMGTELPKNWDSFPGGILNGPTLRAFTGISHEMYVNMAMNPPLCVMQVGTEIRHGRCDPALPNIKMIVDKGCTGRVSTMRVTDQSGRELSCGQKAIDAVFAVLGEAYSAGRSKAGK